MASAKKKIANLKAKDYNWQSFQRHPKSKDKKFSKFHESMLESIAWQDLTMHSRVLYMEIARKFNGHNAEDISFTYEEGTKLMSKQSFTKSIDQLIEHGFIRIAAHNPHNSKANIYAFHTAWHNYGTDAFTVNKRAKRK